MRAHTGKAERLFRAAISAFCSLTRPTRREIGQIEDLTIPLFESVSVESRRFVAAALSECENAPAALVRRLCEETVDIAAPLLVRSRVLTDIDLIALIGRYGLPHARAIARREDLNPTIVNLIKAMEKPVLVRTTAAETKASAHAGPEKPAAKGTAGPHVPGQAAENARHRLRSLMVPDQKNEKTSTLPSEAYAKLRETALTGNSAFFQTALADALDIDFVTARSLTATSNYLSLLTALRALDLGEDKAFLIAVAIFPDQFPHPQAIRVFLDRYRLLHRDAALERARGWKTESVSQAVRKTGRAAANADRQAAPAAENAALRTSRR